MLNIEYVRELVRDILSIKDIENIYILSSLNEKIQGTNENFYTIYINPKLQSKCLEFTLENIYPFTHRIASSEYQYNNISEEEKKLLEEVLKLLNINIQTISNKELTFKKRIISKTLDDIFNIISDLKEDIKKLEEEKNLNKVYLKEKEIQNIINDLKKINIII